MEIEIGREKERFKELSYTILGANKSEICRLVWQTDRLEIHMKLDVTVLVLSLET